jgi:hypothetical protein
VGDCPKVSQKSTPQTGIIFSLVQGQANFNREVNNSTSKMAVDATSFFNAVSVKASGGDENLNPERCE